MQRCVEDDIMLPLTIGAKGAGRMSLGIAFKGAEGIVLAADSRVTLTAKIAGQNLQIPATYDNATKLLKVAGQDYVGAVTYGLGALGQQEPRTAHSYMPEFEEELTKAGVKRLSVGDFAKTVGDFFMRQWKSQMPKDYKGPDMAFLVGGYDPDEAHGHVFEFYIPTKPKPVEQHAKEFGMVWGGQRDFTNRLIHGFDAKVPELVKEFLSLEDKQVAGLKDHLTGKLQAPIPFAFLPLQDCVDVAVFLIRTTITIQNWTIGVRGVGGAIDLATITRTEGFTAIQQKSILGERTASSRPW